MIYEITDEDMSNGVYLYIQAQINQENAEKNKDDPEKNRAAARKAAIAYLDDISAKV